MAKPIQTTSGAIHRNLATWYRSGRAAAQHRRGTGMVARANLPNLYKLPAGRRQTMLRLSAGTLVNAIAWGVHLQASTVCELALPPKLTARQQQVIGSCASVRRFCDRDCRRMLRRSERRETNCNSEKEDIIEWRSQI
jgi:hypothetical protein